MPERIENTNLEGFTELLTPRSAHDRLPVPEAVADVVLGTRHEIRDVLRGVDDRRLVVVVGPCSIHDPEAAHDYARRLRDVRDETGDALLVLMRTYFEKPRTTVGWKGLVNDPNLDGSHDIERGLLLAREILLDINGLGVPCASEVLDPISPQYLADLLSWTSVGARTTESQTHREMASGLSMPVGLKNGTDGSLEPALDAMVSASHPHRFLGVDDRGRMAIVRTTGNPDRHVILRGGKEPNYGAEHVRAAAEAVRAAEAEIVRPVMVDTSHGNSRKDHTRQTSVARDVLAQFSAGNRSIMGLLLESNLAPGNQKWTGSETLEYGVSITDACMGWDETEDLLGELAEGVRGSVAAAV